MAIIVKKRPYIYIYIMICSRNIIVVLNYCNHNFVSQKLHILTFIYYFTNRNQDFKLCFKFIMNNRVHTSNSEGKRTEAIQLKLILFAELEDQVNIFGFIFLKGKKKKNCETKNLFSIPLSY